MPSQMLHVVNGLLSAPSQPADIPPLLNAAWANSPNRHLVLYFHGGLVPHDAGVAQATALGPVFDGTAPILTSQTPTNVFSCFFVWDSGLVESITHNLADIAKDPLFQHMVGKVGLWVLKKIAPGIGLRGTAGSNVDEVALRQAFADYFAAKAPSPPEALLTAEQILSSSRPAATATKGVATTLDVNILASEIQSTDIATDVPFQDVLTSVANGVRSPLVGQARARGAGTIASAASPISPEGVRLLFDPQVDGTRGLINWFKVAKAIAEIVLRVIRRLSDHRDHGVYITISEEVLRELYVDKLGGVIWDQMKKDTSDAFGTPSGAGTLFLNGLAAMAAEASPRTFQRITLIGHSTGAVFIRNLLDKAAALLPNQKFEVVFLAPAATVSRFGSTLSARSSFISGFRSFAMTDTLEGRDSIVPIVYPHSLLYFVSGLLEWSAAPAPLVDEPLVGMQRFLIRIPPFDDASFPEIAQLRNWLAPARRAVWAPASGGPGMNSEAAHHGAFHTDPPTLNSIVEILRNGF